MSAGDVVLAADIGGTNARLALVRTTPAGVRPEVLARRDVAVADHAGLAEPLAAFLAEHGRPARVGCLAVAATVDDERRVTGVNLPWTIDADELERRDDLDRVAIVNDFYAAARGVDQLGPGDVRPLGEGRAAPGEPRAILGAGTGLGQAFLVPAAGGTRIVPTEGGHRDFGPRDAVQDGLLRFLRGRHGRVSTERVLSGPGLAATYAHLVAEGRPPAASLDPGDPGAPREVTVRAAAGDPTCAEAVRVFVDVYGAEASNVALTVLARGGVFLAGGIAPALFEQAALRERFVAAFLDKGRFRVWLEEVPVWVIQTDDLGLLGAAAEAAERGP